MAKTSIQQARLKSLEWKEHLSAPDAQLVDDLYSPALERAVHYDRCCAYFSSSVLSAAARGFGGLIKNILENENSIPKPAVRLLVNEELSRDDVEAMLSTGDYTTLINKLLKQFKTPKDALERDRLKMLTWLAASGWLEVRVGVMRHTGGILHAKYGIVKDSRDDSIAFMGSDNETGEGLFGNYEELRVFTSWKEKRDTDYYQSRFDRLWEDQDDSVHTVSLPKAVLDKLIKFAPKDPPTKEPIADKHSLAAAMMWQYIAAAPYIPNGEYACDATAMVDMWPHQCNVVEDTARAFPAGRLLCDEVGMGKTIEAILVLRRLICGRGVRRALLLVPAGLLKQWQDELREKGGLLVPYLDNRMLYYPNGSTKSVDESQVFATHDLLLVSREWARLEKNMAYLLTCPAWDLTLLDEAHAARRRAQKEGEFNSGNLLLDLIRELQLRRRTRGVLLLSATPMQTQPWEPWDLLSLLGVGGKWIVDFDDIRTFYQVAAELPKRTPSTASLQTVQSLVSVDSEFPPSPGGGSADGLRNKLMFALGKQKVAYADWLRKGAPLGRRMHRNTRETLESYHEQGLLDYAPPKRDVDDVVFDYQVASERQLYDAVKHYIDSRFERLEHEKSGKGFVMTIYRRRAASSPYALRRSLERRLEGCEKVIKQQASWWQPSDEELDYRDLGDIDVEDVDPALPATPEDAQAEKDEIKVLLDDLTALGSTDSKFDKFKQVLDKITDDGRSALVFSEYYDTLAYLRDLLVPTYGPMLACYSGKGGEVWDGNTWTIVSKAEITGLLGQNKLRVLVCTDAASEGLNLQAASALINYDLPWNPSKVEQRIGRIDRIGQQQPVLPIRNMFLNDSVDMRVYQVLRERCGLFKHFVGHMQPVLALARDALRRERFEGVLDEISKRATSVDADSTIENAFTASAAEKCVVVEPPLTRKDLEAAVVMLENAQLPVRVKKNKGGRSWRVTGVGTRAVEVSADRETLERSDATLPLSLGSDLPSQISSKLPVSANRSPLVVGEYLDGAYRAMEVRWVQDSSIKTISSAADLRRLIEEWDGAPPLPSTILKAQDEARKAAKKRVTALVAEDQKQEEAGVNNQLLAARTRLMRELGRTLRCLGSGDLGSQFQAQVSRDRSGRYRKAHELLGGTPHWTSEELTEIDAYVKALKPNQMKTRITGTEVNAALNDPRWKVVG